MAYFEEVDANNVAGLDVASVVKVAMDNFVHDVIKDVAGNIPSRNENFEIEANVSVSPSPNSLYLDIYLYIWGIIHHIFVSVHIYLMNVYE